GGGKEGRIRYDAESKRYWSLSNWVPETHHGPNPERARNTLALVSSADLKTWEVRCVVLYHADTAKHGYQYVDWLVDGADLIALVRTAHDDAADGAHNQHDATYLTFQRVANFRKWTMAESVAGAP